MHRSRLLALPAAATLAVTCLLLLRAGGTAPVSASASDVLITSLNCDASPEHVRIHNFGNESQSLAGFHLQSDPSQDYDLAAFATNIDAGQTIELQSGSGASDNPSSGIYKLTGSPIYRNGDPTDYARLVRPGSTNQQVNCGSTPTTPGPTPTPSPSPTPLLTPSPTATPAAGDSFAGDVTCDRSVNSVDALFVLRFVAGFQPSAWCISAGDINCDGAENSVDALGILRYVAALTPLPAPQGCALAGTVLGMHCGTERWAIKTLSDPGASGVAFAPETSSVTALRSLLRPSTIPENDRIATTELTVFTVQAEAFEMKLEDDKDIHLVIANPAEPGEKMIVELADPTCSGVMSSAKRLEMAQARQDFVALFGEPSTSFQDLDGLVTITGVGFFDYIHGQRGMAPNGIELHPVLAIEAASP